MLGKIDLSQQTSLDRILKIMDQLRVQMTPRDRFFLELGLHASHTEEALARGDTARARAHIDSIFGMISKSGVLDGLDGSTQST
jgi:hypothetical protein